MPLINSPRHTIEDVAAWARAEDGFLIHAQTKRFRERLRKATDALLAFSAGGPCYAGVSWGKDSVVLAHLVATQTPSVPLVWVRVEPIINPDCLAARDAFLRTHPKVTYEEITVRCTHAADGWHASGTLEHGFAQTEQRYGSRHVSGIRGEESGNRKRRMMRWGTSTAETCAPIGWWSGWDVFGYLVSRHLPIHPAYACTMGGLLDPTRLRVASLGGERGTGMGRREWEERYYGAELRALSRV